MATLTHSYYPLRHASSRGLEPLLDEEANQWQSRLHWNFEPTRTRLKEAILEDALQGMIVEDVGGVCGYATSALGDSVGVVGNVFVSPRAADAGLEEGLLDRVLDDLLARDPASIDCQTLFMSDPRIETPFARRRFASVTRYYMVLDRASRRRPPARPVSHGARPLRHTDLQPFANLVFEAHRDTVGQDASSSFDTPRSCARILGQIVNDGICGPFDEETSRWIAIDGDAAAACLITWPMSDVAHVSELATAPEYRGQGFARHCLSRALDNAFDRRGARLVTLSVTATNDAALSLYESMGFSIHVEYFSHLYRRTWR